MAQIAITLAPVLTTALTLPGVTVVPGTPSLVTAVAELLRGPAGSAAAISQDPGNRLTSGTDAGLLVPELVADPLAYYILAKA